MFWYHLVSSFTTTATPPITHTGRGPRQATLCSLSGLQSSVYSLESPQSLDSIPHQDRTACSVCRFVQRNTQKRCTITAGRLTCLSYTPLLSSSPLACCTNTCSAPQSQSRGLCRKKKKQKPVLGSARERERDRGNNNVEAKRIVYSSSLGIL